MDFLFVFKRLIANIPKVYLTIRVYTWQQINNKVRKSYPQLDRLTVKDSVGLVCNHGHQVMNHRIATGWRGNTCIGYIRDCVIGRPPARDICLSNNVSNAVFKLVCGVIRWRSLPGSKVAVWLWSRIGTECRR